MSNIKTKYFAGKLFNTGDDSGEFGSSNGKIKIGITTLGSELGMENIIKGAELAQKRDKTIEVILIGPGVDSKLTQIPIGFMENGYEAIYSMLENGQLDACITMVNDFPVGVSTVGRVVTPAMGKEMLVASTTGTSSLDRVEAMIKNSVHGLAVAKTLGIENPTLGILNVEGSREVERALKKLRNKGYDINLTDSVRADRGFIMRGNDLIAGTADVMATDSFTGNILMKLFSSYTTGGSYEAQGFGYGPGIGEDYDKIILILSRTSGIPVVSSSISYAAELVRGDLIDKVKKEFSMANQAGLKNIMTDLKSKARSRTPIIEDHLQMPKPKKQAVNHSIEGIDDSNLEAAVQVLWNHNIYAESDMVDRAPVVMVNKRRRKVALEILSNAGFIPEPINEG